MYTMYNLKVSANQILNMLLSKENFLSLPYEVQKEWLDKWITTNETLEDFKRMNITFDWYLKLSESVLIGQLHKDLEDLKTFFNQYMNIENDLPTFEEFNQWQIEQFENEHAQIIERILIDKN